MDFPNTTNSSRSNAVREAAITAATAHADAPEVRNSSATAAPPNRQAALQAAAGRHRLAAVTRGQYTEGGWRSILDTWSNTNPRSSFTTLMASRGGINARGADGKTLVEVAIVGYRSGAAAIVAALKAEGADLELPDEDGNRLLHRAVMMRNLEGIKILLANQVDADGFNLRTTLAIARYAQSPSDTQAMMQAPNWTWGDDDQATPLHLAAAFGNDPAIIDALAWYVSDISPKNTDLLSPLSWAAIFTGNPNVIRQLVSYGAAINSKGRSDDTPLHDAALCARHPEITIPALIERGAILEAKDSSGMTALHYAALFPNRRACVALIANGANIHSRVADGVTAVEIALTAMRVGAAAVVTELKAAGADLELPDSDGNTLLHRMVMMRNLAGVDTLLAHGVDVNAFNAITLPTIGAYAQPPISADDMQRPGWRWADVDQASPLHLAAAFGHDPQLIRALIRAGANPNARNAAQDTPLHWAAAFSNSTEVITALLEGGADKNGVGSVFWTPLGAACANSRTPDIALTLIASGASVNSNNAAPYAAEIVITQNRPAAAILIPALKRAGADLELPDADGNHLLHRAVMTGHLPAIEVLLANGVNVNACSIRTLPTIAAYAPVPRSIETLMQNPQLIWGDHDTATPLHLAAGFSNNSALIRLLIQRGADVGARTDSGESPLDWAVMLATNTEVIDALVQAGADITAITSSGASHLDRAARINPDPRMIDAMVRHGADVNAINAHGFTPLQVAVQRPTQAEVVRALVRHGAHINAGEAENNRPLKLATEVSIALEIATLLHEFDSGFDPNSQEDVAIQRYLDNGFSNNADVIITLIELGENPAEQRLEQTRVRALMAHFREQVIPADIDWTPAARVQFLERLDPDGLITMAALHHRPAARPASTMTLPQLEHLHISQPEQASRRGVLSAVATPDAITSQRQLAELRRLLSDPLVQNVELWYNTTDHTVRAARVSAWHAIKDEPHADEFRAFLEQLNQTSDYRHPQRRPDYIRRIAHLLNTLQSSPELRQHCFLLVEDATSSCGDRVGLTLNNLDMARIEHEAEHGMHSAQDLINIRTSQFRIQILGEVAQRKIAALRPTLGDRLDEIEVIHGAITLVAEELNLIGVSRTMLYGSYAHFSDDEKRAALALITQRESRGEYIKFIAEWQPWQKQLRRLRPTDFNDLDQRVATERDTLSEQPDYTSDNDYIELCRRMEDMQSARLAFSMENWTREWLVQNRPRAS